MLLWLSFGGGLVLRDRVEVEHTSSVRGADDYPLVAHVDGTGRPVDMGSPVLDAVPFPPATKSGAVLQQ